jgi:hypothetical protein
MRVAISHTENRCIRFWQEVNGQAETRQLMLCLAAAVPASIRAADSRRHETLCGQHACVDQFVIGVPCPQPDGPSMLPERARFDFAEWWASCAAPWWTRVAG